MELVKGSKGRRVLRWVQTQGQILCHDTAEQKRLSSLLDELRPIFPEMEQVHAWYTYRQQDQPPPLSEHDGEMWKDCTLDGCGTLYAVGISVEGLDAGHDYAVLLVLHELGHVVADVGDNDMRLHSTINNLLARYNQATGKRIENDYSGLEMRYDSTPIPLNWLNPPPAKKPPEGRQFRTEGR